MKEQSAQSVPEATLNLQKEIGRSAEARYDHRLHCILLVMRGNNSSSVARLFGDAPRTVEYWVRRYETRGLSGLLEISKSGRPRRLTKDQLDQVSAALKDSPRMVGIDHSVWNGPVLEDWLKREFKIQLKLRQCQRLLRHLNIQ
jgi:transposase